MNILLFATPTSICAHFSRLGVSLAKRGHKVVLVADSEGMAEGFPEEMESHNVQSYVIKNVSQKRFRGLAGLCRILQKEDINVIHTQGVTQSVKAYMANKATSKKRPIVTTVNSIPGLNQEMNMYAKIASFLLKQCSDLVICPSRYLRSLLLYSGAIPNNTIVMHNAIDLDWFDRAKESSDNIVAGLIGNLHNSDIPLVVCVARLEVEKGIEYLLIAAERVLKTSDARFLIIGDGSTKDQAHKLASKLNIEKDVFFAGRVPHLYIPHILDRMAYMCVLPSLKELLPFFVLEAMAAAKPVVSTSVGGVPEAIRNSWNGYLVPPRNPESLAAAITGLLDNPDKSMQMGVRGRKLVEERFSAARASAKLEALYSEKLEGAN